ncbi:ArsC/Spx/MgsR family protein [Parasedimentitalea maritima]|uniref:Arsenate reductase n=1 Tax=Parasedimentitalea maritima TaxID=2578117 RepID=A0A6A4R8D5_9RHOB|nr:ArsC/Spx/MgsR family protein [Zongyanglinia marina]KAE9627712.1 arsenate reductase [Zongyanglinia marina]
MKLFGLKNCDNCRKALKLLPDLYLVDVRRDGVPDAVLERALGQFGDSLLNIRSTTWRALTQEERLKPPFELIKTHPALMKRPLIERDGVLYLGWSKETQAALGV